MMISVLLIAIAFAVDPSPPALVPNDLAIWTGVDTCGICTINFDFKIDGIMFARNSFIAAKCEDTNDTASEIPAVPADPGKGTPAIDAIPAANEEGNIGFMVALELDASKMVKKSFSGTYILKKESTQLSVLPGFSEFRPDWNVQNIFTNSPVSNITSDVT